MARRSRSLPASAGAHERVAARRRTTLTPSRHGASAPGAPPRRAAGRRVRRRCGLGDRRNARWVADVTRSLAAGSPRPSSAVLAAGSSRSCSQFLWADVPVTAAISFSWSFGVCRSGGRIADQQARHCHLTRGNTQQVRQPNPMRPCLTVSIWSSLRYSRMEMHDPPRVDGRGQGTIPAPFLSRARPSSGSRHLRIISRATLPGRHPSDVRLGS
jgi:hypothetical protein